MTDLPDPAPEAPYARPRHVTSPDDCYFYHTMEVPGLGVMRGEWDLRPGIDAYLGRETFAGKRVLDVGAASGFLSFHMEERGAVVVSYDLSEDNPWDIVPFSGQDMSALAGARREHLARLTNAYWLCHRVRGSRARAVYGTAYAIPDAIGPVDIAVLGSVLLHLRDPFLGLWNAVRLARETAIVTDVLPRRYRWLPWLGPRLGLSQSFLPRFRRGTPADAWWVLPPALVVELLGVLGFATATVTRHAQLFVDGPRQLYTIVARRTGPTPPLPGTR